MDNYDYKSLVQYIVNQSINLAESFEDWTKLAFSLSTLGEEGRNLFHAISRLSSKYKYKETDVKFSEALRNNRKTDISTFVWMAQRAGIDTNQFYTNRPMEIAQPIAPKKKEIQHKDVNTISFSHVEKSASSKSDFIFFLCGIFDRYSIESPTIERLINEYALGATKDGDVIFWQIDHKGKVRTGKIMKYSKDTGHRIKEAGSIRWVHCLLKKKGLLPAEWKLTQCLFGEHLLTMYPKKTVCLVEAEKTAIIASGVYPQYNWLATGGKSNMNIEKLSVLKGRTVIFFPDVDAFSFWTQKAEEMRQEIGCKAVVSDLLNKTATEEDRSRKIDIADLLVKQLERIELVKRELSRAEAILADFRQKNPAIIELLNTFDCVPIEDGKHA